MHKLLAEQISRYLGPLHELPEEVRFLLKDVDRIYRQAELLGLDVEKMAAAGPPHDKDRPAGSQGAEEPEVGSHAQTFRSLSHPHEALLGLISPVETACALVEQFIDTFDLPGGAVTITDFSTGEMIRKCMWGPDDGKNLNEDRYIMPAEIHARLRAGKLMLTNGNAPPHPEAVGIGGSSAAYGSIMRVPVVVRDHLVAVLDLFSVEENAFDIEAMQAAQDASNHVAVAVQQAALLAEVTRLSETLEVRIQERTAELQKQAEDISMLNDMGELLQSCSNVEEAYDVVQEHLPRIFPKMAGALAMVTKKDETFSFIRSWGLDIDPNLEYRIEDCWGLRRGQPHMVETNQGGLLCHHVEGAKDMFSERTLLCIPLGAHSGSEGFLHLRRETSLEERKLRGEEGISLATQQLALTVGEQVGLALANLALQESLRIQAIRDPITGLFNRRYMEESLVREIQRSIRNGSNLGVIMLDIDHFKVFNDRFGHAVGDALLRELGTFLQERVRKEDIACKYGGEEFVLIMPNADLSITADRAELIRREVKDVHVEEDGKTFDNITLSLGVSVFPMHGRDGDAVLKVADTALYQAKAKGRDQVVVGTSGKKNSGKDRRN